MEEMQTDLKKKMLNHFCSEKDLLAEIPREPFTLHSANLSTYHFESKIVKGNHPSDNKLTKLSRRVSR